MLKRHRPAPTETLPGSNNVSGKTSSELEKTLKDLSACGMRIEGQTPVEVHITPDKSVKNQLISLVSQGRMYGVTISRDADQFDPPRMTRKLSELGFNANQVNRFMRSLYDTPAI